MNGERAEGNTQLLTCWKDIAAYLGKGVRTVQRWEQQFGMPVLRPSGTHHKSAVIARTTELDSWMDSQWSRRKFEGKGNGNRANMDDLIQTAQALRSAHILLMEETSSALQRLLDHCNQLDTTRRNPIQTHIP